MMPVVDLHNRLVSVEPLSIGKTVGFWDGYDSQGNPVGGFGELPTASYPESPLGKEFRRLRVANEIRLGRAAELLGLTVVEISSIERGRLLLKEESDWVAAFKVLDDEGLKRWRKSDG